MGGIGLRRKTGKSMSTSHDEEIEEEKKKYTLLQKHNKKYGASNHAKPFYPYIEKLKINSLIDIGTGQAKFCEWCINKIPIIYALDFVYENAATLDITGFFKTAAHLIPLETAHVEYVTAFDVLEHIPETVVPTTLEEFRRVSSKGALFTISTRKSNIIEYGNLHPTVRKMEWWIEQIYNFYEPMLIHIVKGGLIHCER